MSSTLLLILLAGSAGSNPSDEQGKSEEEVTWRHVVYLGGAPGIRVDRSDLEQTLTLSKSKLTVKVIPPAPTGTNGQMEQIARVLFEIPCEDILDTDTLELRHDKHATQGWVGIRGVWPKSTDHLIVVRYRLPGTEAEVLIRVSGRDVENVLAKLRKASQARKHSSWNDGQLQASLFESSELVRRSNRACGNLFNGLPLQKGGLENWFPSGDSNCFASQRQFGG